MFRQNLLNVFDLFMGNGYCCSVEADETEQSRSLQYTQPARWIETQMDKSISREWWSVDSLAPVTPAVYLFDQRKENLNPLPLEISSSLSKSRTIAATCSTLSCSYGRAG